MLEKSRVVHQSSGEANFHIFYNFMCGFTTEERKRYFLEAPEKYRYYDKLKVVTLTNYFMALLYHYTWQNLRPLKNTGTILTFYMVTLADYFSHILLL